MISGRRRSITAGGDGEGTPNSSAERTTTILRRRSGGRRATTHRQGLELQRSINQGQPLGQNYNISGEGNISNNEDATSRIATNHRSDSRQNTMNYIEIKQIIERRITLNKKKKNNR